MSVELHKTTPESQTTAVKINDLSVTPLIQQNITPQKRYRTGTRNTTLDNYQPDKLPNIKAAALTQTFNFNVEVNSEQGSNQGIDQQINSILVKTKTKRAKHHQHQSFDKHSANKPKTFQEIYNLNLNQPFDINKLPSVKKHKRKSRFTSKDQSKLRADDASPSLEEADIQKPTPRFETQEQQTSNTFRRQHNSIGFTEGTDEISRSTTTGNWPYSVAKVRLSRAKIEHDVVQMQNRIQLLEQEEKRALRRIEETRSKADQILQNRHEQLQFKKCLSVVRQQEYEQCLQKVKMRNTANDSSMMSGSVMIARQKVQQSQQKKLEEAMQMKKDLQRLLKKKERQEIQQLKQKQQQRSQIKEMEQGLKFLYESVHSDRLSDVRMLKANQIKAEIFKISKKDQEARKLEKREENLLKRLKETHALQQETLIQIQDIFQSQYLNESSLSKLEKKQILVNQTSGNLDSNEDVGEKIIVEDKLGEQLTSI